MEYRSKFSDPRWQRKRLEVMQRDRFQCCHCCSADKTLNVHHRYYVKNRDVWDYPLWSLLTLCEDCHLIAHPIPEKDEGSQQEEWESTLSFIADDNTLWECALFELLSEIKMAGSKPGYRTHHVIEDILKFLKTHV